MLRDSDEAQRCFLNCGVQQLCPNSLGFLFGASWSLLPVGFGLDTVHPQEDPQDDQIDFELQLLDSGLESGSL